MRSGNFKGIKVRYTDQETTFKIQQIADDITLFIKDEEGLDEAVHIFQEFALISGLPMSQTETEAMWLDRNRHYEDTCHGSSRPKTLGIYFRNDKDAFEIVDNWSPRVENTKRTIKQWSRRNLNIYGKILIAKTVLNFGSIYILRAMGLPYKVPHTINHALFSFAWKKKTNNKIAFENAKRKVLT